jgi:hypothetical protein
MGGGGGGGQLQIPLGLSRNIFGKTSQPHLKCDSIMICFPVAEIFQ